MNLTHWKYLSKYLIISEITFHLWEVLCYYKNVKVYKEGEKDMTQMKEEKTKKDEKYLLATDYSIPRFSFKQALLLVLALFLNFSLGTFLLENAGSGLIFPLLFLVSISTGFSITSIQFYKREVKKKTKGILTALFSVLAFIILFSFYFANTIF